MQVQQYDPDTFVIRQSIRTNFEGPFLYLLFGSDKALLLDSGAGGLEIRPTIDKLIAEWSAAHGRASTPLVVAHSHSHGDHLAGDAEFAARPDTTVIGLLPAEVAAFFGITGWPREIATLRPRWTPAFRSSPAGARAGAYRDLRSEDAAAAVGRHALPRPAVRSGQLVPGVP